MGYSHFLPKELDGIPVTSGFFNGEFIISCGDFRVFLREPITRQNIDAGIANIGGAMFDKKHPGQFLAMIKRQAIAACRGEKYDPADEILWQDYAKCCPKSKVLTNSPGPI